MTRRRHANAPAVTVGDDVMVQWAASGTHASPMPTHVHIDAVAATDTGRGRQARVRVATRIANRRTFIWNVRDDHCAARDPTGRCYLEVVNSDERGDVPIARGTTFWLFYDADERPAAAAAAESTHAARDDAEAVRQIPSVRGDVASSDMDTSDDVVCLDGNAATLASAQRRHHHHHHHQHRHAHAPPERTQHVTRVAVRGDVRDSAVQGRLANTPESIMERVYMRTGEVRRHLATIVRTSDADLDVNTPLDHIDADGETPMCAGEFCVRYLLLEYYRKHVSRECIAAIDRRVVAALRADAARARARRRDVALTSSRGATHSDDVDADIDMTATSSASDSLSPGLAAVAAAAAAARADGASPRGGACVDDCTIPEQRAYLRYIRETALDLAIDKPFPHNVLYANATPRVRDMTIATFALEYVRTNRRKRTLNVRRAKHRARSRIGSTPPHRHAERGAATSATTSASRSGAAAVAAAASEAAASSASSSAPSQ